MDLEGIKGIRNNSESERAINLTFVVGFGAIADDTREKAGFVDPGRSQYPRLAFGKMVWVGDLALGQADTK